MSTKTTRQGGIISESPMMQTLPELSALPLSGRGRGRKKKKKNTCFSASQGLLVHLSSQLGIPRAADQEIQ